MKEDMYLHLRQIPVVRKKQFITHKSSILCQSIFQIPETCNIFPILNTAGLHQRRATPQCMRL